MPTSTVPMDQELTQERISPAEKLLAHHKSNVAATRQLLLDEIGKIDPVFREIVKELLAKRIRTSPTPPLGELIPWILSDVGGIEPEKSFKIATGWVALYLYATILDDQIDKSSAPRPEEILTGAALFQFGLSTLRKFTQGSRYDAYFENALYRALSYELQDAAGRSDINDIKRKSECSERKNSGILACAAAFAAVTEGRLDYLIEFTESLLLAFQYLDDIADREDDLKSGNITVLLAPLARTGRGTQSSIGPELLNNLLDSDGLEKILDYVQRNIQTAVIIIKRSYKWPDESPTTNFLTELRREVISIERSIRSFKNSDHFADDVARKNYADRLSRRLTVVAQSS